MQPGSFDDEGLEYAKKEFAAGIGGSGWCILEDGDEGLKALGEEREKERIWRERFRGRVDSREPKDESGCSSKSSNLDVFFDIVYWIADHPQIHNRKEIFVLLQKGFATS